jgi:hypothetical protein
MRKILLFFTTIFCLLILPVSAETQYLTLTPSPNSGEIKGINAGNKPSFEIKFSTSDIPISATIQAARLHYSQTGVSGGLLRLIDRYSADVIDSRNMDRQGSFESTALLSYLQKWKTNPNQNLGVLWQTTALGDSDQIAISEISLDVDFTIPDKDFPTFNDISPNEIGSNYVAITVITDELTYVNVNYGKTSLYGQQYTTDNTIATTEHNVFIDNLMSGVTYHFRVNATDLAGNKTNSTDLVFSTLNDFDPNDNSQSIDLSLSTPSNFRVMPVYKANTVKVYLSWDSATEKNIRGYYLYRANETDKKFTEYKTLSNKETSFIDDDVQLNSKYYYYLRSFSDQNLSPKTSEKAAVIPAKAPTSTDTSSTTLQTFLFILAATGLILFMFYLMIKVGRKLEKTKSKHLTNVLKDPTFYTNDQN